MVSPTRRWIIAALPLSLVPAAALAAETMGFEELYSRAGVLGRSFAEKPKRLAGATVAMEGYMAPPLKAEANFFVLGEIPMSICPFCSSDSDWPDNIVVVYLDDRQTFTAPGQRIRVTGTLEVGSWTDPETGFVSLLRLRGARFETV